MNRLGYFKEETISYKVGSVEDGKVTFLTINIPIRVWEASSKDDYLRSQMISKPPENLTPESPEYFLWFTYSTYFSCTEFLDDTITFETFLLIPEKSLIPWQNACYEVNPDWFPFLKEKEKKTEESEKN